MVDETSVLLDQAITEEPEGASIPDLPEHRVDILTDGLHSYFKVLYLAHYSGQLVTGHWYGVFHTWNDGVFFAELMDADNEEAAYKHTRLVVGSYEPGSILASYVFKCLGAGDNEHVIQWAPTSITTPVVMDFHNTRNTFITQTIH